MTRLWGLCLLAVSVPALGGCVAGMAASAAGMAVRGAQGTPKNNAQLGPEAVSSCSARASAYGTVHIIDAQQTSISKIVVWGTADNGTVKRSFECSYGTKVTGFKLRAIPVQR